MFLHHGACMHRKSQQGIWSFKLPPSPLNYLYVCGLVVFTDMNYMYILTEGGRSFKTLFKENYAIALDSCDLFTKKC